MHTSSAPVAHSRLVPYQGLPEHAVTVIAATVGAFYTFVLLPLVSVVAAVARNVVPGVVAVLLAGWWLGAGRLAASLGEIVDYTACSASCLRYCSSSRIDEPFRLR